MYQPLSELESLQEIQRLKNQGLGFDKAIQNLAFLNYLAEKNNAPARDFLLQALMTCQQYPRYV